MLCVWRGRCTQQMIMSVDGRRTQQMIMMSCGWQVNMDRHCPDHYVETTEESVQVSGRWLALRSIMSCQEEGPWTARIPEHVMSLDLKFTLTTTSAVYLSGHHLLPQGPCTRSCTRCRLPATIYQLPPSCILAEPHENPAHALAPVAAYQLPSTHYQLPSSYSLSPMRTLLCSSVEYATEIPG